MNRKLAVISAAVALPIVAQTAPMFRVAWVSSERKAPSSAPLDAFQLNVTVTGWFAAPSAGLASVGVGGGAGNPDVVVKLHTLENALVPPLFFAFTRQ